MHLQPSSRPSDVKDYENDEDDKINENVNSQDDEDDNNWVQCDGCEEDVMDVNKKTHVDACEARVSLDDKAYENENIEKELVTTVTTSITATATVTPPSLLPISKDEKVSSNRDPESLDVESLFHSIDPIQKKMFIGFLPFNRSINSDFENETSNKRKRFMLGMDNIKDDRKVRRIEAGKEKAKHMEVEEEKTRHIEDELEDKRIEAEGEARRIDTEEKEEGLDEVEDKRIETKVKVEESFVKVEDFGEDEGLNEVKKVVNTYNITICTIM